VGLVEIRHLNKSFSGTNVLTDVDFDLERGEVHALVGENRAGKSTFIKILSGACQRDSGSLTVAGTPLTGGRGSIVGTLTGVLLLGIIASGLNLLHVDPSWQYFVTGGVIVLAVLIQQKRGWWTPR
jgi:ABC-type phosphate/phosphonate transport system ATPase subunit